MKACAVMLQWSQTIWFLQNWNITCMVDLLGCAGHLQEAENMVMEMEPENVHHMWMHGWLCLVLVEFMVMWRLQNVLPNRFLKWSLKMLSVMYCCQIYMLLLARDISVRMLNGRERKNVHRNSQVASGLK